MKSNSKYCSLYSPLHSLHLSHCVQTTVFMGSAWKLHPTLAGAFLWLLVWTLCSLLFPVFSDVPEVVSKMKEQSLEGGIDKEKDTERLNSSGIQGMSVLDTGLPDCVKLMDSESVALQTDGDIVIGGLFPLHYVAPKPLHSYSSKPQLTPCSG